MTDNTFMVSDSLRDMLPDDVHNDAGDMYVHVVAVPCMRRSFVGLLKGLLVCDCPEVDIKVELHDALAVVSAATPEEFASFQFNHAGALAFELNGPFVVDASRIYDIDVATQTCVLSLLLKKRC